MQTDVAVEISEHAAQENQNQHQTFDWAEARFRYLSLYQAALKGDWQKARDVLDKNPEAVKVPITAANETALHIAVAAKHTNFVKELLNRMDDIDLKCTNKSNETALYLAAASGIVVIAQQMVVRNNDLTLIRNMHGMTPLYIAALLGRREMALYLFSQTSIQDLSGIERIQLIFATISNDLYDIALEILREDPSLATAKVGSEKTVLNELARKPFANSSKSINFWFKGDKNKTSMQTLALQLVEVLWSKVQLLPDKQFSDHVKTFLFDASEMGNLEFLIKLIGYYPDLIWITNENRQSMFHIAVLNRQETVFNLIYDIGAIKDMILVSVDDDGQNILHLAGKLAPTSQLNTVSGAALQMQSELLWFKKVERIVEPSYRYAKNNTDSETLRSETPWELFIREHKDLKTEGEKWMKDRANNCMLVATLVTTVVFAAAFTVPGGSNQDNGTPILLKSIWFRIFFIADAIALFSSSTSIFMFLSILTSTYTEMDFLVSLPSKLLWGLVALFISIAGMLVAFSATCFLVFKSEMVWLPIVITALAGVPIISFVRLHYKLSADIVRSTYLSRFSLRQHKNRLFYWMNNGAN